MADIIFGLYVVIAILVVKLVIYVIRLSIAQRRVNKAYKAYKTWSRRHDWAIEDGYYVDMTNYEWSVEEVNAVFEKRKIAFDKAVGNRDIIRF
jgi:hypothetical protein